MGKTLQLRVSLRYLKPPIWRRIVVPSSLNLAELHAVIQGAMGWMDDHLHMFTIGGQRYAIPHDDSCPDPREKDERKHKLGGLAKKGKKFDYIYDFGDCWRHSIAVEDVKMGADDDPPKCIAGKRACPPEDCGGARGYARLLAALSGDVQAGAEDFEEWEIRPERFELSKANRQIGHMLELYRKQ